MNPELRSSLQKEFSDSAGVLRREELMHAQRLQRERFEKREDMLEQEAADLMDMVVGYVTASEIADFKAELDTYDAATVTALQENEEALEQVQARIDEMFEQAHVLPDGRRVFKTKDGLHVFDENGAEIGKDEIEPDEIENWRPRWENVGSAIDQRNQLMEQRQTIHEYQAKLDEARERLDQGRITREEYNRMRKDLRKSMPEPVREHVPGMEAEKAAEIKVSQDMAPNLDIPSDMVPTAMAPTF